MPWITLLLLSQCSALLGAAWSSASSETPAELDAFAFFQSGKLFPEASSLEGVSSKFKTLVEF